MIDGHFNDVAPANMLQGTGWGQGPRRRSLGRKKRRGRLANGYNDGSLDEGQTEYGTRHMCGQKGTGGRAGHCAIRTVWYDLAL